MFRNNRLQMLAVIAVSAAGGWLAASGRLPLLPRSDAAPPAQAKPATADGACCEGADRGLLLAKANPATAMLPLMAGHAADSGKKPNILMIMGDDIGMWNIGAYHRGMMAGRTPNLDKLAKEGMLFTDYYAEASCTAGRANFITGELPIRTGMTTVGQAGAKMGLPAEACTIATALKAHGLRHWPVRQESSGRPQRVPAHRPRLRRILRLPVSPGRNGRPGASQLSAGTAERRRPAQHGSLLGHRQGRPDRDAALGQNRQAKDRRRRQALSQTDGDRR